MNRYYFDWQENEYYSGIANISPEKTNNIAVSITEAKTRKISLKTCALFLLTASMISTLTAIGTLCLGA